MHILFKNMLIFIVSISVAPLFGMDSFSKEKKEEMQHRIEVLANDIHRLRDDGRRLDGEYEEQSLIGEFERLGSQNIFSDIINNENLANKTAQLLSEAKELLRSPNQKPSHIGSFSPVSSTISEAATTQALSASELEKKINELHLLRAEHDRLMKEEDALIDVQRFNRRKKESAKTVLVGAVILVTCLCIALFIGQKIREEKTSNKELWEKA